MFKLNPSGSSLRYSTFIGGSSDDWGYDITVDFMGNAYITGCTYSINFPVTPGKAYDTTPNGISDAVVIKMNPSGSSLIYSSYIGGMDNDQGYGIAIDSECKMHVVGSTKSIDFPNTTGVYDPIYNGGFMDSFIVKIGFNIIPYVIDLNVSTSSILRPNTIHIYSNGTDIEDLESELIPTFEYRNAGHATWLNKSLSTPVYVNNRWQVSFLFDKTIPVGFYNFRVKYRDTGLLESDWFYLNKGLKVLNNYPEIEDLMLSKEIAIQNENVSMWVNGNDIEDPEQNLTVDVEYREPSDFKWNITFLKLLQPKPEYVVDKWMINFTIPFGAPFGYYDFRANITDTDGNYTGWLFANDSLLITNCKPELLNVGLSQYIVYRNKSILLYANCNDYETPEAELNYRAGYKYKSDSEWSNLPGVYSIDCWASEFITYIDSKIGDYYFRVNFEDSNNESTGWQYLEDSLGVLNNPPMISYALNDIEIGMRAKIINLTPFKSDVEDKNENLSWSVEETQIYEYLESVEIIDPVNNLLKIVPLANVVGEEDIELTLTDKDGGTDIRSNITVHVDSRITEKTPKVTLLSPADDSIINTLTPKLEWELYNPEGETITFTVFLDENPEPKTVIQSGLTTTYFILANNLENAKTYYWWVVPSWGVTLSKPHNFTIDLNFMIEHDLSLMSERSYFSAKQGESATINFTINNEGNVKDTFIIEYSASRLQNFINVNKSNIQLETGKAGIVGLKIDLPLDFELGEYTINVNATSTGNKSISAEVNVIFEVLSRFFIANYDVSIEVTPESIFIEQSRSYNVTLIIENTGNIADEYYIKFRSDTFTVVTVQILDDDGLIFVKAGFIENISVNIMVPEVIEVGAYLITFISNSQKAFDDAELTVNVLEKADSSKPPKDTQVEKKDNFMFYLVMAVIIIIVILILVFLFIRKKKEEKYLNLIKNEDKDDKKAGAKPIEKGQLLPAQKLPVAQPIKVETSKGLGGGVPQASPIVLEQQPSQKKKPPEQSYTSTTSTTAHTTPSEPSLARKVEK
ncbi:MAG: SBBP repeat-containing protein [Thermoplasmata archaeon]|nr:SBBP repeat-containing protein [Thermoplasmata archaeon]